LALASFNFPHFPPAMSTPNNKGKRLCRCGCGKFVSESTERRHLSQTRAPLYAAVAQHAQKPSSRNLSKVERAAARRQWPRVRRRKRSASSPAANIDISHEAVDVEGVEEPENLGFTSAEDVQQYINDMEQVQERPDVLPLVKDIMANWKEQRQKRQEGLAGDCGHESGRDGEQDGSEGDDGNESEGFVYENEGDKDGDLNQQPQDDAEMDDATLQALITAFRKSCLLLPPDIHAHAIL
jgi:hypothetical protein